LFPNPGATSLQLSATSYGSAVAGCEWTLALELVAAMAQRQLEVLALETVEIMGNNYTNYIYVFIYISIYLDIVIYKCEII
jgi:hypothetical protein